MEETNVLSAGQFQDPSRLPQGAPAAPAAPSPPPPARRGPAIPSRALLELSEMVVLSVAKVPPTVRQQMNTEELKNALSTIMDEIAPVPNVNVKNKSLWYFGLLGAYALLFYLSVKSAHHVPAGGSGGAPSSQGDRGESGGAGG